MSRAHLFYSKLKKKMDMRIKDICVKEDCLRTSLLKAIRDTVPIGLLVAVITLLYNLAF